MRIAWLDDNRTNVIGGAGLSTDILLDAEPEWATVRLMGPEEVEAGYDLYLFHNCAQFPPSVIRTIGNAPVMKVVRDPWQRGSCVLRDWILKTARLLFFSSPLHLQRFPYHHRDDGQIRIINPPVNTRKFIDARERMEASDQEVTGACWVGRFEAWKGLREAIMWAHEREIKLTFYGAGRLVPFPTEFVSYGGQIQYDQVPEVMARHEHFVHLPTFLEPFGRTVVEAYAAGCNLWLNENIGALPSLKILGRDHDYLEGADALWNEVRRSMEAQ